MIDSTVVPTHQPPQPGRTSKHLGIGLVTVGNTPNPGFKWLAEAKMLTAIENRRANVTA
ncbi:hypothetical protein [Mameliella sp.]|uniref:hypothetical protein n=1 Tax=Mameliella sp. TaxID=1924940 RepID=UPI003B510D0D